MSDQCYFIDMELCDLSLAEYVHGTRPSTLEPWNFIPAAKRPLNILRIVGEIVNGLMMIHLHDEIHRDLSPSNSEISNYLSDCLL